MPVHFHLKMSVSLKRLAVSNVDGHSRPGQLLECELQAHVPLGGYICSKTLLKRMLLSQSPDYRQIIYLGK